ncbi:MAG TPA: BON domain-containing protein [Phycisphaerales bacterium]
MKNAHSIVLACVATVVAVGCERRNDTPANTSSTNPNNSTSNPSTTPSTTTGSTNADNTANNKRDQSSDTKTPIDQSNSKADIDITAAIRRAIMDDKSLSMNAQNCKIITENGVTTLRGPVESQTEKDAIEAIAKRVSGVTRVDNQLEVKAK